MTEFIPQSNHAARRVPLLIPLGGGEAKVLKEVADADA